MEILVVDDNIDSAEGLADVLELEGHHVKMVHDGRKAVEAYQHKHFDLVFMDLKMPHMDGVEATRLIKESDHNAHVIVVTGNTVLEDIDAVMALGIDALLRKPFDVNDLINLIPHA